LTTATDRAGVDQDHAGVPGSVHRISSARSAKSCAAESVPALAKLRRGSPEG
jgi:hypothetical protein